MKKIFIILIIIGFACSNNVNQTKSNSFEIKQILPCGKKFYVNDSSQYSPEFIQELRTINTEYDSVRLIEADLILSKTGVYKLPTELPLDKQVIYQSERDGDKFELRIKRINFTAIDYEFRYNDKVMKTGQVLLSAGFIFGEETSGDFKNGDVYGLTQYFDKKGSWACIKVENGNANRIELSCDFAKDSTKNSKGIPTLRKR